MSGDFTGDFDAFLEKQSVAVGGETATKPDGFAAAFDKTLDDLGADPATAAKGNLFEANKGNPDEAAKAASAAQVTGLPPDTVERNLSEVSEQIKATRQAQAMADNPQLARFYADRRNAVVAHDDFDRLGVLSKVWAAGARGVDDAVDSNAAARAALPFVGGDMDAATSALVKRTQAATAAPFGGDDSSFYSFVRKASGFVGGLVDQGAQSVKMAVAGATLGAGVGAIGGPAAPVTSTVGAGVGAVAGFTAGMVADGFKVGAGQLYLSLKDQKDANGNPLDPTTVKYAALGGGAILGLLNMVGAGGIQKPVSAAASGAMNLFIKDAVAQPTAQRAFVEFGKGIAKSAATGAAFGAANEATNIAAETIAKTFSGGDWATILNDPEQRKAALNRVFASMAEMSTAFGVMHGVGGTTKLGSDMLRARQAEKDAGWIDRVNASIGETATAGRDRDAIQRFLGLQADGTPVDNVFVPASKVVELYQSFGLDPYRLDNDPILGFMPDLHDQLREAETTHGDVVIPAKDYFAKLAGTEVFDKLKGDIRLRPDGMSFNEARDAHQEREANFQRTADEFREKMEAGDEAATPGERVYGDVFGKLRAAGYTNDAAGQQAAVYASHHQTRAARNPERFADAWASHESAGLKVEQVLPESIRYAKPDQLDVLLNSLRSGKDPAAPKDGRATLLESIAARGGMVDEGGELKARDLDRWHLNDKGKPIKGRAPLIRDPGQEGQGAMFGASGGAKHSLDDTALSAWENGYFPEHPERPGIDHLLAAIDEETHGRPRYSEDAPHDPRAQFKADREELDAVLGRLGIDLKKTRNKDVRELLSAVGDGAGGYEQEHRGSIKFTDGAAIVSLFQGRDLSTFLHETGHLWLEELKADAAHPLASDGVKADFAAVLAHLGVKDGNIEVAHHEQFARSFEAYLMEGKAPSDELRAPFQKFKAWLVAIYKNLVSLNAPMSDTLRGVFDRLIATDDEIAAARAKQELNPIFATPEDAGMTKAEYAAYTSAIAKAHDAAEASALNKVMADVRQRRTKEWKEEETATREAVTSETMNEPGQATLHLLRTGKLWGDRETPEPLKGAKLSKDDLVAMYGDEAALKMLPFGIYKADGGLIADGVADAMGFSSGRAMVDRLMGLEAQRRALREKGDKRSVARSIIEQETDRRMTERHGDALTDGSIQAEAMASVHNERQVSILGTEMRALAKQAGEKPATVSDIRKWAADAIAGKVVKDAVAFGRYAKAERDAGLAAQRALLKGDKLAAFRAKQDQLVNHALYVEAKKAAHDRDVAVRMMDNYAGAKTIKSMAQDYLDQIHNLLEAVEFKDRPSAVERARNFAEWAVQQQADGVDVVAGQKLLTLADKQHYTEMTVSELRGLADTVRQVAHLGRMKKTLIVKAEKVEFDAKVDEAVAAVAGLRQMAIPDARNPGVAGAGLGEAGRALWERTKGGARSLDASLLKMEQVFDWLDKMGGGAKGVFNSVVFRPLSEAQNLENRLQTQVTKKILALNKAVPKEVAREWQTRQEIPELIDSRTGKASSMLKTDVIAIALNMGNASNKDKLLRGEKWSEDAVKTVLDRSLTKHDWEYVQGVWDTIDALWPYIETMEKAVNGVAPDKVEALAVETPHGTIRGGYYPVVYDPARAGDVAQRAAKSADSLFENIYTRATTSRGFTNERVESYARPILLSLDVIPRHVSEVIHDLAWREPIRQADKFLADKRIREAVEGALGREVYDQFRPWLQNMANEWALDRRGLGFWDKVAKGARTSASIVGMGFRLTTMMAQVTGISDSAEVIGVKWMGKGLSSFAGDPMRMAKTRDFVFAKSEEMQHRMDTTERDVREALRSLVGKKGMASEVKRFAYYGIGMMDMAVSLPTWMGAYEKALHEGMTDADAAYSADKAIRSSQGAGSAKDLAAMQRGTEFQKLATMFYSYFNHMYNRQRDLVRSARDAKSAGDFAMVAARSFFLLVVPAIVGNIVSGQGPKDDENVAAWAARKVGINMFLGVPIVRDAANMIDRQFSGQFSSYAATPAARAVDVIDKALEDLFRAVGLSDAPVSDEWVKHAFETTGYVFGMPTGQGGATAQFLWDVNDGSQDPQSISDWFKGLMYGRYEDKKPH